MRRPQRRTSPGGGRGRGSPTRPTGRRRTARTRRRTRWLARGLLDPDLAHDGLPAAVLGGGLGACPAALLAALGEDQLAGPDPARPRAQERLGALLAPPEVG